MTGRELINWIQDNNAENLEVLIEHRDSGGTYHTAEHIEEYNHPMLVDWREEYDCIVGSIVYDTKTPRAILL